ncbi:MAG: hypothetical protein HYV41_01705 [Candidatus Magasanikbacteria bacterium]|nr:hypothetical protein [Candidatus Magasanikbacteria bacterium]
MSSKNKKFKKDDTHVFVTKELPEERVKPEDEVDRSSPTDSKKITQKLIEIYENGDGSMPDMQKFEKRTRSKVLRAFFVLLFALLFFAVVAWLGFFVIVPQSDFNEEDVILTISGDEEISYGAEVSYRIRYRNAQNIALDDANLEVRYPKGFVFVTSSIATTTDNNDAWKLGTVDPQGSGYMDITGRMYGDISDAQSFRVFLNYIPANFSSQFQKVAHVALTITEAPLLLDVEIPSEVVAGAETKVLIHISPQEGEALSHIQVSCESEMFSITHISGSGSDENKNCRWTLDQVTQKQEFQVSGSFLEDIDAGEKQIFRVVVSGWQSAEKSGEPYTLTHFEKEVMLSKAQILFNVVVNGGTGTMTVEPGENLNMSAMIKNSGDMVMHNAALRVVIEAPSYTNRSMLNWGKLDVIGDADIFGKQLSDTVRQGELVFDKRYIAGLAQIMPGEEVGIDIVLPIKNGLETTLANYKSSAIRVYAELKYTGSDTAQILNSNEVNLAIVSDLDIDVTDAISQDVEGNAVHTVTWLVSNSFHDLKNLVLEADVYGDISIDRKDIVVPAGELEYDDQQKKIIWKIDTMPTSIDVLAMHIPIVIKTDNPSQKNLTSKVTIKAHDVVSDTEIVKFGEEILLSST